MSLLGVYMNPNPPIDRQCPGCGGWFQTAHEPPAERCVTCRMVWHDCATCGQPFGLDPLSTNIDRFGPDCLSDSCGSYDIARDPTYLFAPDDPNLIEDDRG